MFAFARYHPGADMARQLTFTLEEKEYAASPVKIDRRKLYGWTEVLALDDAGNPCEVVSTDDTGRYIIPRGGTAVGLLSPAGEWVERSQLQAVTPEGRSVELLPSSFSASIRLNGTATEEMLLDHDITDFYELTEASAELVEAVGDTIYTFDFCYTDGCEGNPAFLLAADDRLFLLVGRRMCFGMVGYEEPGFIDEDPDEGDDTTDGGVDFAMF